MVGSGVRENNIATLVEKTKAREYHSTAKKPVQSKMQFKNRLVLENEETASVIWATDAGTVRRLKENALHGLLKLKA